RAFRSTTLRNRKRDPREVCARKRNPREGCVRKQNQRVICVKRRAGTIPFWVLLQSSVQILAPVLLNPAGPSTHGGAACGARSERVEPVLILHQDEAQHASAEVGGFSAGVIAGVQNRV